MRKCEYIPTFEHHKLLHPAYELTRRDYRELMASATHDNAKLVAQYVSVLLFSR